MSPLGPGSCVLRHPSPHKPRLVCVCVFITAGPGTNLGRWFCARKHAVLEFPARWGHLSPRYSATDAWARALKFVKPRGVGLLEDEMTLAAELRSRTRLESPSSSLLPSSPLLSPLLLSPLLSSIYLTPSSLLPLPYSLFSPPSSLLPLLLFFSPPSSLMLLYFSMTLLFFRAKPERLGR